MPAQELCAFHWQQDSVLCVLRDMPLCLVLSSHLPFDVCPAWLRGEEPQRGIESADIHWVAWMVPGSGVLAAAKA